jgi:small subunit ribosomal protein S1
VFEDEKKAEETAKRKTTRTKPTTTKAVKQVKENSAEKTTLGDISELAALRTQMEADELKEN